MSKDHVPSTTSVRSSSTRSSMSVFVSTPRVSAATESTISVPYQGFLKMIDWTVGRAVL